MRTFRVVYPEITPGKSIRFCHEKSSWGEKFSPPWDYFRDQLWKTSRNNKKISGGPRSHMTACKIGLLGHNRRVFNLFLIIWMLQGVQMVKNKENKHVERFPVRDFNGEISIWFHSCWDVEKQHLKGTTVYGEEEKLKKKVDDLISSGCVVSLSLTICTLCSVQIIEKTPAD